MSVMSVQDIRRLSKMLGQFLNRFEDCFSRQAGRDLLLVYVQRLMSSVQRKNVEAMALEQNVAPRTLQRLLDSIAWDEERLRDRCQQIVASEHAHPEAIGCVDETGTAKSGSETAGVKRQYNGNRGKIENCVNHVAVSYSAPDFSVLIDARLYLPAEWANDPARRKNSHPRRRRVSQEASDRARHHRSREAKEDLGLDHFECRNWHCIHRHLFLTILSQLFCARVRKELTPSEDVLSGELLTIEQVRRAVNVVISTLTLPPRARHRHYDNEANRQNDYARRNAAAAKSHRKKRHRQLAEIGIDPDKIKSVTPPRSS